MFDRYLRTLEAKRDEILQSLAAGNAADYAAYRHLVGRHEGLNDAINALNRLMDEDDRREL